MAGPGLDEQVQKLKVCVILIFCDICRLDIFCQQLVLSRALPCGFYPL